MLVLPPDVSLRNVLRRGRLVAEKARPTQPPVAEDQPTQPPVAEDQEEDDGKLTYMPKKFKKD